MNAILKPIPTEYKGIIFRSKSEAIYARFLDLLNGISINNGNENFIQYTVWKYEPEWVQINNWIPDFYECANLKSDNSTDEIYEAYIEYKPSEPTDSYLKKCGNNFDVLHKKLINCYDIKRVNNISYIVHSVDFWNSKSVVYAYSPHTLDYTILNDSIYNNVDKQQEARKYRFDLKKNIIKPTVKRKYIYKDRPEMLVRKVLALVLHHPYLAQQTGAMERLQQLQTPGIVLLLKLLNLLKVSSGLGNMGAILDRFRDDEHYDFLEKLAIWEYPMREQDVKAEFQHALCGLNKAWISQSMDQLLQKKRMTGKLNKAELKQMQSLLSEKHNFKNRNV